mmetsp:Transcript_34543/g.101521  ORF Transcript_34543/g.101521 Transcript_34543/m.101521 type:complete len:208 (-) Transcript_34543:1131-1754(-)
MEAYLLSVICVGSHSLTFLIQKFGAKCHGTRPHTKHLSQFRPRYVSSLAFLSLLLNIDVSSFNLFVTILPLIPNEEASINDEAQPNNNSKSNEFGNVTIAFVILHFDIGHVIGHGRASEPPGTVVTETVSVFVAFCTFPKPSNTSGRSESEGWFAAARIALLIVQTNTFVIHPPLGVCTTKMQALPRVAVRIFITRHTTAQLGKTKA